MLRCGTFLNIHFYFRPRTFILSFVQVYILSTNGSGGRTLIDKIMDLTHTISRLTASSNTSHNRG